MLPRNVYIIIAVITVILMVVMLGPSSSPPPPPRPASSSSASTIDKTKASATTPHNTNKYDDDDDDDDDRQNNGKNNNNDLTAALYSATTAAHDSSLALSALRSTATAATAAAAAASSGGGMMFSEDEDNLNDDDDDIDDGDMMVPSSSLHDHLSAKVKARCAALDDKNMKFYGQENIDVDIYNRFFSVKDGRSLCGTGVFVDIGANDGQDLSNSKFFEQALQWRGICVEPNPTMFNLLTRARPKCNNYNLGIAAQKGKLSFMKVDGYANMLSGWFDFMSEAHKQRIDSEIASHGGSKELIEVESNTLHDILEDAGYDRVDFLSIDVEGAELEVLKGVDFTKIPIHIVILEANPVDRDKNEAVKNIMVQAGFKQEDFNSFNLLYVNPNFNKL